MSIISLINKVPFGNPAEKGYWLYKKAPADILSGLELKNFQATVRYVAEKSPFYKRRFQELGIEVSKIVKPEDLKDFFTTPEDIRNNPEEFICQTPDTAYETTGTTSKKPKRVYFSRTEVQEAGWAGAVGLWGIGVRPDDRVVSAFDYSFWVSGPVLSASCQVLGCFHVEAGRLDPADFYDRIADYKPTVIVGDPSWLVRFAEIADKKGCWKIKLLIGGGENLTEEARRYCEKVLGCDYILSYGQTEAFGAIGMESLAKDGYHLNEFHNYFEIINIDEKGYGELVYTNLNRRVMPLVRYRSGDITRFMTEPCTSGLPGRRIAKLKGRIDEWTVTAMGNLAPWMFEDVFAKIPDISPDWQIVVDKEGMKDKVTFHVESDTADPDRLQNQVTKALEANFSDQTKQRDMGLLSWNVQIHPKNSLRGSGRKIRRIVDKRKF